jgi:solute carrier family 30 (zinc transporter), member 2
MTAELVGGIISGSLAILSDAAHMLSDFSGFAISMISIIISRNKPTFKLSYGYHRAEVIGALCSILLIWGLTAWLVYEAVQKVVRGDKVDDPMIMLIVAIIGLICNIVMGHVLHSAGGHHHHGHSHGGHSHDEHNHDEHDHKHEHKNDKHKLKKKNKVASKDSNKDRISDANTNIYPTGINNISTGTEPTLNEPLLDNSKKVDDTHDHEDNKGCDGQDHHHHHEHHIHENQHEHDHDHNTPLNNFNFHFDLFFKIIIHIIII